MFKTWVLVTILGPNEAEVTGSAKQRNPYNVQLHDSVSPDIITILKTGYWAGHAARVGEKITSHKALIEFHGRNTI